MRILKSTIFLLHQRNPFKSTCTKNVTYCNSAHRFHRGSLSLHCSKGRRVCNCGLYTGTDRCGKSHCLCRSPAPRPPHQGSRGLRRTPMSCARMSHDRGTGTQ